MNNEDYRKEENPRDARLTTATLAAAGEPIASKKNPDLRAWETEAQQKETGAGDASTSQGIGTATAGVGAALAKDEQTRCFCPKRRRSFAVAEMPSRETLWMSRAERWSRLMVWSRRP